MIEWLWQQALVSCLLICAILLLKPMMVKHIGAVGYYLTWAFIPVYLLFSIAIPTLYSLDADQVTSYLVTAKSQQQIINYSLTPHTTSLLVCWGGGFTVLTVWMILSHWRMLRSLKLPNAPTASLSYKKNSVNVFLSKKVSAPFITLAPHYTIVVPQHFSCLDPLARKLVIRHELVHMARGDLWWNILAIGCALVFWFNPLSWIGYREFRHAQELSCDAIVLKSHRPQYQVHYANTLLKFAATPSHSMLTSLPYSSKEQLKERIMNLKTSINRPGIVATIAVTLLSITGALQALELNKDHGVHNEPVYRATPVYPAKAVEQNIEGAVTLKFDIEQDGSVSDVKVVGAEPAGLFDQAAQDAVNQWQYQKGAPKDDVLVEIAFALGGDTVKVDAAKHEVVQVQNKK
ncbi:TonB family protein [Alteromonas ponticola]|uniref:Protein TonB n=1 Tax=Alteromonas aquimaris TaxID=2998417 RepID=A0ABT3PAH2_9ALTE|nr:M56 family metallopeptidase [Alteromonas aquimaris]MCW8109783.1 TonB family protein [Alteromonas aquimaris]